MRRDILIRGNLVTEWSNEYHTGLAPEVSLISQEDWEDMVGAPAKDKRFSELEQEFLEKIGWKFDLDDYSSGCVR